MWKEPLGNPSDDVGFLQNLHPGASKKAIEREYRAYIQPKAEICKDVDYFFEQLGIRVEPEIKNVIKKKINERYSQLHNEHFTYCGRRSVEAWVFCFTSFLF